MGPGVCATGACRCDSPWRGPGCGQLAFRPSAKVASLVPDSSSWGGSIVEVDGAYHGFFCRIASVFNITDGDIVHATARDIDGPYQFGSVVGRGEGPEVVVQKLANGTARYVLFTSPDGHQRQFGSIRVADSIEGPFRDVPGGFAPQVRPW